MNTHTCRQGLGLVLSTMLLTACGGGGNNDATGTERSANGSYLYVTHQDQALVGDSDQKIYFGPQDVSSTTSIAVRIANRGADVYPLTNISIEAPLPPTLVELGEPQLDDNSEEFSVQVLDDIILQPAEAVTVEVSFSPITKGNKHARFVVDYETIQKVNESVNINEQDYYLANDMANAGKYQAASETYASYLENSPVTTNKRRAAIRLPIINEAQSHAADEDLGLYLESMSDRDDKNYAQAIKKLDVFAAVYSDSHLADDALYLKGYIQLMDLNDAKNALRTMQSLRDLYPDTNYYDTSLYIDAIAQTDLGHALLAKNILMALKQRHTSINALGIELPKDNIMSRMWFDRATQMLDASA